ncbi:hypothetical protein QBC38DRAFT_503785 [Podospora fimiseda]|uniref:Uncharacterized protein n=1 Tax=Podospora fimiseda TaxID=252190 RepID=A0AAN6YP45_9PEZI|nr:hypothetical protein QBC38DRAFT_503785 [Podospora fimiseda]
MAITALYPNQHGAVDLLTQEGNEVKDYVATVTETFISRTYTVRDEVNAPESPQSLIPSTVTRVIADQEVKAAEDAFKAAMREYEGTVKKKYKTGINPDEQHTIHQLESIVSEAIQKHQHGESKGAWGKINLACRKLSEGKDSIEGWLGILPSENNYLSIVSGGLKLILKTAARITKVRDKILEALQQIPSILNSAQRVLNIYHDSAKLKELSKAFYISTLSVLGHILHYLRRKASSNLMKVVFQPGSFQEDLFLKLEQLTKDRNAFNEEADLCQKEMLDNLGKVIQQDNHEAKEERAKMEHLLRLAAFEQGRANRVIGEMLEAIKRRQSEIGKAVDAIKTAVTEPSNVLPRLLKLLQGGDGVQGFAISMLKPLDLPKDNSNTPANTQSKKKKSSHPKPSASQIRKSILSSLSYSPTIPQTDLSTLLSLGPLLPKPDQDRSLHLINSPLLHSWISNPNSASLLINGNGSPISRTRSPISFVTARLSFALEQLHQKEDRNDIIPLYFFSGLHYAGDEEWETPAGVMNSLLAQVLSKCRDVDLSSVYDVNDEIDCHDVSETMDLFEDIIKEICKDGSKTIFVIVDGLSFWLDSIDEESRKDAEVLGRRLIKLSVKKKNNFKKKRGKGVIKVLLSAGGRFHFDDGIQSESGEDVTVLDLPVNLPPTSGFTNMKWDFGVGRWIEALTR